MKLQSQIRQNAEEMSSYISDLQKWEKTVSSKDKQLASRQPKESRNVIIAAPNRPEPVTLPSSSVNNKLSTDILTPASLADKHGILSVSVASVPKASTEISSANMELKVREFGNEQYQKGNFAEAVKLYTKCLGLKVCILYYFIIHYVYIPDSSLITRPRIILGFPIELWRT